MITSFTFVKKREELFDEAFFVRWPDMQSLTRTEEFYAKTERGKLRWADLLEFMDIDHSPTVIVTHEADVGTGGITPLFPPGA